MKTLGIIGGTAPESTIEYYRLIVAAYRKEKQDGSYPPIIINSIDLKKMLDLIEADQLLEVTHYLLDEIEKLARAGADVGLLASNTPHIVFEDLRRRSPIPLICIVESACDATKALGINTVGLFGTRFTMQGRFYRDVFSAQGITLIVPDSDEQDWIHDKYMNELVRGVVSAETRERLLEIVEQLAKRENIRGLILGGTELSLILGGVTARGMPFLDTTKIHAHCAVAQLWS